MCEFCDREMLTAESCLDPGNYIVNGKPMPALPYGVDEDVKGVRCRCNVAPGGFHHPGCILEKCPSCQERMVICKCLLEV